MNPHEQFCPNSDCPARGQVGKGNIHVHSAKERRYRCQVCGKTFSERKGTAVHGLKHPVEMGVLAVRHLLDRAQSPDRPTLTTSISPRLIVRDSVRHIASPLPCVK